jgi:hypothetical protein
MYDMMDSDAYENVLIYPATRKIATDDPYYTAYEYFQRCCEHAKICVAVGYSFRDYDGLMRLRGAADFNPELKLALIAPDAESVLKRVVMPPERKIPISKLFGQESPVPSYLTELDAILDGCLDATARSSAR